MGFTNPLSEFPLTACWKNGFLPNQSRICPCTACWKAGEGAPYLHLARTFEILEKERGRLKMADILCNMFRRWAISMHIVLSRTCCFVLKVRLSFCLPSPISYPVASHGSCRPNVTNLNVTDIESDHANCKAGILNVVSCAQSYR
jgi:hypothetical protein